MKVFKPQMKGFTTSKGTLQIPYGTKIPAALVTKMVKHNLKKNLARAKAKAAKKSANEIKSCYRNHMDNANTHSHSNIRVSKETSQSTPSAHLH